MLNITKDVRIRCELILRTIVRHHIISSLLIKKLYEDMYTSNDISYALLRLRNEKFIFQYNKGTSTIYCPTAAAMGRWHKSCNLKGK